MAWDDLQYILAVAEHGSLAAAARALKVNHTTVLRRINAFEKAQGVRLFDRLPAGYALTAGGEELLAAARSMADVVSALERKLAGADLRLEGGLRVTTTDTLMASILPEVLAAFHAAHPGVQVELSVSNLMANLTRRDADVAIRPADEAPETLIGRRICSVGFAIYGSPAYLRGRRRAKVLANEALTEHRWLGPDDSLAGSAIGRWMRRDLAGAEVALRADSLLSLRQAALAGLGLVALPCYLGDTTPGLKRLQPLTGIRTALWVLTHEDLRRTARVNAFMSFASRALAAKRKILEG